MENISIEHKIEQFKTHILDNKKVILSAKFGDGKLFLRAGKRNFE